MCSPNISYLGNKVYHAQKTESAVPGDVAGNKEWAFFRRHYHVEGPAAASPHHLAYCHVRAVEVRSFFPVNFYANERRVHQFCNFFVVEAFLFHDVAPMARRVSYGDENRLVLCFSCFKSYIIPWIPIYRIICVLKQIRTFFVYEPVRLFHPLGVAMHKNHFFRYWLLNQCKLTLLKHLL